MLDWCQQEGRISTSLALASAKDGNAADWIIAENENSATSASAFWLFSRLLHSSSLYKANKMERYNSVFPKWRAVPVHVDAGSATFLLFSGMCKCLNILAVL